MLPSQLPDIGLRACAVDSETSGLHFDDLTIPEGNPIGVSTVSVAWFDDGEVVSYAWPFDQGIRDKLPAQTLSFDADPNLDQDEWDALMAWLQQRRLVFHNAKFDLHHLRNGTRHWPGVELESNYVADTALACRELWPLEPLGLKPTAERLGLTGGGEQDTKDALKAWIKGAKLGKGIGTRDNPRYDLVPWPVMEPYAAMDAELTIRLYDHQQTLLGLGFAMPSRVAREDNACRVLYRMERRGMGFDSEACLEAAVGLEERLAALRAQLPFEPTLPAAKRYFFDEVGTAPVKTTEKGAPQLDDEVRDALVARGVEWAKEYGEYRQVDTALSMWYHGWPDKIGADGRLRMTFRQTQVKSGRMSAERVQLQAVPKDDKTIEGVASVRGFFQARPGHTLWNLDLSQAELRVASKVARCKRMLEMLEQGADLHGITTQEIFGISKGHPDFKVKRDIAKRLTFGGIFQIGPKTFQATLSKLAGIHWSLADCSEAVYRWRDLYPEFGWAYNRYDKLAAAHNYIYLVGHEKSWFGPRDWSNTAWNRRVQGSLAKFVKLWLPVVEAQTEQYEALVMTVHDSAVLELPDVDLRDMVPGGEDGAMVHPVALAVAEHGSEMASRMFGITMPIDVGTWHKTVRPDSMTGSRP